MNEEDKRKLFDEGVKAGKQFAFPGPGDEEIGVKFGLLWHVARAAGAFFGMMGVMIVFGYASNGLAYGWPLLLLPLVISIIGFAVLIYTFKLEERYDRAFLEASRRNREKKIEERFQEIV